ncbi:MAG: hypothetical protein H0Z34_12245 [Brevibacillus sp.]|nr:hypothetical protein [Brevibacillus sp.]
MLEWVERVIRASWQQRLKTMLTADSYWVYVAVVVFVTSLLHQIVLYMFQAYVISLLFTLASVVVGAILFAIRYDNRREWLEGSLPIRTCIELWNHDEDEE